MTLSTATQEEFLRALDQDPEFRQRVRRHVLSVELIELPERLAELAQQLAALASQVSGFIARQEEFNAEIREGIAELRDFNAEQRERNARQEEFNAEQRERNARQDAFNDEIREGIAELREFNAEQRERNARQDAFNDEIREGIAELRESNRRAEIDLGILKGSVVIRVTRDRFETILDQMGLDYVKLLSRHDLVAMMRRADSADIAMGDRQSFYRADLIVEASDSSGISCYIAVEASYTADTRDTGRAVRNADFLSRFTGHPAYAVIASVSNDREAQLLVDEGTVFWHRLTDRDLQPE